MAPINFEEIKNEYENSNQDKSSSAVKEVESPTKIFKASDSFTN